MPTSVVDIDLSADTAAPSQPTFNDIVLIEATTVEPDSVDFNKVYSYTDPDDVESDTGEDFAVVGASEAVNAMGTQSWGVLLTELQEADEEIDDGTAVANAPIRGDTETVTVTVGDEEYTVVPTTSDPTEEEIAEGEAAVNFDTGVVFADSADPVEVSYAYIGFDYIRDALDRDDHDLIGLAGEQYDRAGIGDLDELTKIAGEKNLGVVGFQKEGAEYPTEQDALEAFQDIASYVPSGDLLFNAHKDSDTYYPTAYTLGQLATNQPWFDPFWDEVDGAGYPFDLNDTYSREKVGDPATAETFEGGDAEREGPGNVLIEVNDRVVLSNSLTTAGFDSDYRYFDIGRTQAFIAAEARDALTELRLKSSQIPFTSDGRSRVLGAIRNRLSGFVGGSNAPLTEISVTAPQINDIDEEDVGARIFPGIEIDGQLAGNMHEFGVELHVRV